MQEDIFSITDAIDHDIIMHREVHFGGDFSTMLDYYRKEGKGIHPEFNIPRIERLAQMELQLNQNLAPLLLSGSEAEKVAQARQAYKDLRKIYEIQASKHPYPRLIADLILSEDDEAESEISAIVQEKDKIVPELIALLRKEEFHDPLFPGYGQSPSLAVKCLGLIGDKRAIISLFEEIGQGDFFSDEYILKALKQIGNPAKEFLIRVLNGFPLTEDNERAAIALIEFKDDPEVAEACFKLLKNPTVLKDACLPTYLVLACTNLPESSRHEFIHWSKENPLPRFLLEDVNGVISSWQP